MADFSAILSIYYIIFISNFSYLFEDGIKSPAPKSWVWQAYLILKGYEFVPKNFIACKCLFHSLQFYTCHKYHWIMWSTVFYHFSGGTRFLNDDTCVFWWAIEKEGPPQNLPAKDPIWFLFSLWILKVMK